MTHGQALATIKSLLSNGDVSPEQAERLRHLADQDHTAAVSAVVELRQLRSEIDHESYLARVDAVLDAAGSKQPARTVVTPAPAAPAYEPPGEVIVGVLYGLAVLSVIGGMAALLTSSSDAAGPSPSGFVTLAYSLVSAAVLAAFAVVVRLLRHIAIRLHHTSPAV